MPTVDYWCKQKKGEQFTSSRSVLWQTWLAISVSMLTGQPDSFLKINNLLIIAWGCWGGGEVSNFKCNVFHPYKYEEDRNCPKELGMFPSDWEMNWQGLSLHENIILIKTKFWKHFRWSALYLWNLNTGLLKRTILKCLRNEAI